MNGQLARDQPSEGPRNRLVEQEAVERDDQAGHAPGDDGRARGLVSVPISPRLRVKSTSGIRAKGMPKESTTWLMTSVRVGSTPMRDHDQRRASW